MDHITIANRAVARIGGIKIQSFDEPGPSGHIVPETYHGVLDDLLGKYPWHFTKARLHLARETKVAIGWKYSYALPANRLAPPRAIYDAPETDKPFHYWEPRENSILTNAERLYADCQMRKDPAWWPAYFRELVVLAVAAELAGALREDWQLRAKLRTEVYGSEQYQGEGGQFAVAASLDAQSQPSPVIDGNRNPIVSAGFVPGDARDGYEDW